MKHLIVYDNFPQCPHAIIVQQMFLQFISLILFIDFIFPMNNVTLSVSWASLDIVFFICSFIWLHLNVIWKKQAQGGLVLILT